MERARFFLIQVIIIEIWLKQNRDIRAPYNTAAQDALYCPSAHDNGWNASYLAEKVDRKWVLVTVSTAAP